MVTVIPVLPSVFSHEQILGWPVAVATFLLVGVVVILLGNGSRERPPRQRVARSSRHGERLEHSVAPSGMASLYSAVVLNGDGARPEDDERDLLLEDDDRGLRLEDSLTGDRSLGFADDPLGEAEDTHTEFSEDEGPTEDDHLLKEFVWDDEMIEHGDSWSDEGWSDG